METPEWKHIDEAQPKDKEPCKYQILITCHGWYDPIDGMPRFIPDERKLPMAEVWNWIHAPELENYEDGVIKVKEYLQQKELINESTT